MSHRLFNVVVDLDFTEWALPLEIWWLKNELCFEVLCFSIIFYKGGN